MVTNPLVTSEDYTNTIMFIFNHKVPICRKNSKQSASFHFTIFFRNGLSKMGQKIREMTITQLPMEFVIAYLIYFTNFFKIVKVVKMRLFLMIFKHCTLTSSIVRVFRSSSTLSKRDKKEIVDKNVGQYPDSYHWKMGF